LFLLISFSQSITVFMGIPWERPCWPIMNDQFWDIQKTSSLDFAKSFSELALISSLIYGS
jgi:hypothetical protein